MAMTPEDVSNKRFTTVRLREGYDMTEVDQFLDEVEAELGRRTAEHSELRAKLEAAQAGPATGAAEGSAVSHEQVQVTTTAEASAAATRLLELAGRNADELVLGAREEAERILSEARAAADSLTEETQARSASLEEEARSRAEALQAETQQRRESLFGDIERQKAELEAEIETLRTFEREYRAQLRTYFEDQLASLEGLGTGGVVGDPGSPGEPTDKAAPSRLQSILAEED